MENDDFREPNTFLKRVGAWIQLIPIPFKSIDGWYSKLLMNVPRSRLADFNEFLKNGGVIPKSLLSPHQKFLQDGGNSALTNESEVAGRHVVLLGGYLGDSTQAYLDLGAKEISVFEPIADFYSHLSSRFSGESKVKLISKAAWVRNELLTFSMDGDGTGLSGKSDNQINVEGISLSDWLAVNSGDQGVFVEMNIEGSEYPLISDLVSKGAIMKIDTLLVQFHDFNDDSELQRAALRQSLRKTHVEVFNYPWIWEKWSKK